MHRSFRSLVTVSALLVALAANVSAAPRERGPKEKTSPVAKVLKSIIRALGDGLTIPHP